MNDLSALIELLSMLLLDARTGTLIALLVVAALIDWRTMRIPNWLTVGGMVLGLAISTVHGATVAKGLGQAAGGLSLGLLVLLPLYLLRVLGAGDVKLMAMVGAFLGPSSTIAALIYVVVTGGIAAILVAAARGTVGRLAMNVYFIVNVARMSPADAASGEHSSGATQSVGTLPYGVSICLGTLAYLVTRQLGFA